MLQIQSDILWVNRGVVLTSTPDAPKAGRLEPKNRLRDLVTGWEAAGLAVAHAVFTESRTCV